MDKRELDLYVQFFMLRALIASLGEAEKPAWWKSDYMNETGLKFMERIYPRTFFHAAIRAAGKAAADAHDRAVGRIGVYHLFRLPESLEAKIHRMSPDMNENFFTALRNALGRPEELFKLLAPLSGGEEADAAPGAKKIGNDKDLMTAAGLRKAAAVYRLAFERKKPGFPYFTAESI